MVNVGQEVAAGSSLSRTSVLIVMNLEQNGPQSCYVDTRAIRAWSSACTFYGRPIRVDRKSLFSPQVDDRIVAIDEYRATRRKKEENEWDCSAMETDEENLPGSSRMSRPKVYAGRVGNTIRVNDLNEAECEEQRCYDASGVN